MSYLTQYAVAQDADFIKRVTVAASIYAETVMLELPATPGHAQRVQFALSLLRSPQVFGPLIAQAIITDPLITLASTDPDLLTAVTTDWNALAGYSL